MIQIKEVIVLKGEDGRDQGINMLIEGPECKDILTLFQNIWNPVAWNYTTPDENEMSLAYYSELDLNVVLEDIIKMNRKTFYKTVDCAKKRPNEWVKA